VLEHIPLFSILFVFFPFVVIDLLHSFCNEFLVQQFMVLSESS
jgi:hypothetical protein